MRAVIQQYRKAIAGNAGRLLTVAVVGFLVFYALAFISIYSDSHSYETSSRWIFENVPPGSKIAGVHWDDRVPVSLPGRDGQSYNGPELALYEPDTPQKWEQISRQAAVSDYIALPTQRLPGSLLRVPEEYPQTASFFRQLYAGHLGYKLVKTVKKRPALLDVIFDDDVADESISVYDHPKVSIFQNVERLSPSEIKRRIYEPPLTGSLPSLREVMEIDMPLSSAALPTPYPQWAQLLLWMIALEILTWIAFPFVATALSEFPDRGFGAARTLGFVLFGVIAWQLSSYGLLALRQFNLCWLIFWLALLSHLFVGIRWGSWSTLIEPARKGIRGAQTTWILLFALFTVVHGFQPEIFWGEKPMDFTFLNYFVRLDYPPPNDPWASGEPMHYYYLGSLFFALIHKFAQISPSIGYNLAVITVAAMIGTSAYSVFSRFGQGLKAAVLCGIGVVLLSNFEVLKLTVTGNMPIGFDLFWASTRLFTSPCFAEYPLWSILFADLHAHVIAIPIGVAVVALFLGAYDSAERPATSPWLLRILIGTTLGAQFIMNTWDLIAYGAIFAAVVIFRFIAQIGSSKRAAFSGAILDAGTVGVIAFLTVLPFLKASASTIELHYGWVQRIEFNNLWQVLSHLGIWVTVIVFGYSYGLDSEPQGRPNWARKSIVILLSLVPFALGAASIVGRPSENTVSWAIAVPWDILILSSVLIFAGGAAAIRFERTPWGFTGILTLCAGFIVACTELLFLNDRMNTIFKFYTSIWILLSLTALGLTPKLFSHLLKAQTSPLKRVGNCCIALIPAAALIMGIAGGVIDIYAMTTFQRLPGPRPTLDGERYMTFNPEMRDDGLAMRWISDHVPGTPAMLEAQGDSYREFTRFSMHTGLPTVLGWEYHVQQRGTRSEYTAERKRDIRRIYETTDLQAAMELLRKYNVQVIVVGAIEGRNYSKAGLEKFEAHPELFPLLFRSGTTSIYTTSFSALTALKS